MYILIQETLVPTKLKEEKLNLRTIKREYGFTRPITKVTTELIFIAFTRKNKTTIKDLFYKSQRGVSHNSSDTQTVDTGNNTNTC